MRVLSDIRTTEMASHQIHHYKTFIDSNASYTLESLPLWIKRLTGCKTGCSAQNRNLSESFIKHTLTFQILIKDWERFLIWALQPVFQPVALYISHYFTIIRHHSSSFAILIRTVFHKCSWKFAFFDRKWQTNGILLTCPGDTGWISDTVGVKNFRRPPPISSRSPLPIIW